MRKTYNDRDVLLLSLGFNSYNEYLSSSLWLLIRRIILRRDRYRCRICRANRKLTVHHIDYGLATLVGLNPAGMVVLCHRCHEAVEFHTDRQGQKTKLALDKVRTKTVRMLLRKKGNSVSRLKVEIWLRSQGRNKDELATAELLRRLIVRLDGGRYIELLGKISPTDSKGSNRRGRGKRKRRH